MPGRSNEVRFGQPNVPVRWVIEIARKKLVSARQLSYTDRRQAAEKLLLEPGLEEAHGRTRLDAADRRKVENIIGRQATAVDREGVDVKRCALEAGDPVEIAIDPKFEEALVVGTLLCTANGVGRNLAGVIHLKIIAEIEEGFLERVEPRIDRRNRGFGREGKCERIIKRRALGRVLRMNRTAGERYEQDQKE